MGDYGPYLRKVDIPMGEPDQPGAASNADGERATGPLASCGKCTNGLGGVVLDYGCDVHGGLAEWLSVNVKPLVVAKVTEAAHNAERTSAALDTAAEAIAGALDKVSAFLRGKDPED
jgi:hypothetical protein